MSRFLLILVVILAWASPAWAAKAGQVSVPLRGDTPQGDEARRDALQRGLETVIARLTGRDPVTDLPGVAQALEQPQRWLLRYSYEDGEPPRLRAVFDERALTRHLADQGAPVWGGQRPPVLVWLVTEGTGRGDLVTAGDPLAERLRAAAGRRGVSLKLPEWDQRDRDVVAVADVRGRFDGPVLQASRRYDTDWVATGVLYGGASTTLNWRLLDDGNQVAGQRASAADADAALNAFVDALADQMAERYSLGGESGADSDNGSPDGADANTGGAGVGGLGNGAPAPGTTEGGATPPPVVFNGDAPTGGALIRDDRVVTVRGVRTLKQWHDLYRALADSGPLRGVALRVASDDRVQFELDFSGGRSQVERLMAGVPGLAACGDAAAAPLTYCLR